MKWFRLLFFVVYRMFFLATFLNLSLPDTLGKYLDPPAPPDKAFRGPKHLLTAAVCCFWLLNFLFAKHLVNEESSPGFLERAMPYESLQCMFGVLVLLLLLLLLWLLLLLLWSLPLLFLLHLLTCCCHLQESDHPLLICSSRSAQKVIASLTAQKVIPTPRIQVCPIGKGENP